MLKKKKEIINDLPEEDNYIEQDISDEEFEAVLSDEDRKKERATNAEMNIRVTMVAKLILEGHNRQEIITAFANRYRVSIRTIDRYIRVAYMTIYDNNSKTINEQTREIYSMYKDLYMKAMKDKQWGTCRAILKNISELKGLDAPKKTAITDVDGNNVTPIQIYMPDNQRKVEEEKVNGNDEKKTIKPINAKK